MTEREKTRIIEENRRLRRENEYLRHRLASYGEKSPRSGEMSPHENRFAGASRMAMAAHKRTYFGYLLGQFKSSFAFRLWDRTRFAVRGFFLASKIWNLLIWIFVFLGFGTQFVLWIGALVVLLPAALVASLILGVMGFFSHRRWNQALAVMMSRFRDERIYIVFAPKAWREHDYFCRMLADFEKNGFVFLVFHSYAACGYKGAKKLTARMCAVHISYYFSLKKHLEGKIIQIYSL